MYAQDRLGIKFEAFNVARKLGYDTASVRLFGSEESVKFIGHLPKPKMPVEYM